MIFPLKTVVVINFIARWDYRKNKQHAAGDFVVLLCKNYANREDFAQYHKIYLARRGAS